MSLIIPKTQILYAPMLGSLGGGSVRGFGRGIGGGPTVAGVLFETPGSHTYIIPANVFSISAVAIGGGGGGSYDHDGNGGGGGGLGWKNNIAVSPGQTITVNVGAGGGQEARQGSNTASSSMNGENGGDSNIIKAGTTILQGYGGGRGKYGGGGISSGGMYAGDGGGAGGGGSTSYANGAGGAGGYSGNGGNGNENSSGQAGSGGGGGGGVRRDNWHTGSGGGTGIYGQGANGAAGTNGGGSQSGVANTAAEMLVQCGKSGSGGQDPQMITNGAGYYPVPRGGAYGGGGGAPYNSVNNYLGRAGHGAVRIIWGEGRAFPSTNVDLASSADGEITV
jgi:hypothetical protein